MNLVIETNILEIDGRIKNCKVKILESEPYKFSCIIEFNFKYKHKDFLFKNGSQDFYTFTEDCLYKEIKKFVNNDNLDFYLV